MNFARWRSSLRSHVEELVVALASDEGSIKQDCACDGAAGSWKEQNDLQDGSGPENGIMLSVWVDKDVRMVVVLYGNCKRITFRVRPSGRLRVWVVRLCFVERDDRGDVVWQMQSHTAARGGNGPVGWVTDLVEVHEAAEILKG